jgi:hypothetical protein
VERVDHLPAFAGVEAVGLGGQAQSGRPVGVVPAEACGVHAVVDRNALEGVMAGRRNR